MFHRIRFVCASAALSLFVSMPVSATTLQEALALAYQTNPSLAAARAGLRAQDEGVAQAVAGLRPTLGLSMGISSSASITSFNEETDRYTASLQSSLLLFDGGRTQDAISSAENTVWAAQADLQSNEQGLLLQAAIAYLDVRRDQQFLSLAMNNVNLIEQQVLATENRFDVGAVTSTDVALARARLAAAQTSLAANSGGLALSKEIYRAIIGAEPINLASPPQLPGLPSSLAEAESVAMREHPAIIAARYNERAAEFDLMRARKVRIPTVSLGASIDYSNTSITNTESTTAGISLNGQMPIYQGGALSSAMRQAAQILATRKATTQDTMRAVRQATASAWANIRVARASIVAARLQIEANEVAYRGIEEELRLGARTTLDLLDAEQELLTAKSNLASAQRDEYVAGLNLLASMGLLTVENLSLGIPAYDPNVNFNQVRRAPTTNFAGGGVLDAISDRWE